MQRNLGEKMHLTWSTSEHLSLHVKLRSDTIHNNGLGCLGVAQKVFYFTVYVSKYLTNVFDIHSHII